LDIHRKERKRIGLPPFLASVCYVVCSSFTLDYIFVEIQLVHTCGSLEAFCLVLIAPLVGFSSFPHILLSALYKNSFFFNKSKVQYLLLPSLAFCHQSSSRDKNLMILFQVHGEAGKCCVSLILCIKSHFVVVLFCFLDDSHSQRSEIEPQCSFDLHYPDG
jgi:hypothetical protein